MNMETRWTNKHFLHLDTTLLLGLLTLLALGLIILYSAGGQNFDLMLRQIIRIVAGLGIMLLIAQIPIQKVFRWVPWIYIIGVVLLALVLLIGTVSKGSQRWINLGFFAFQPSEIMKLIMPMMVTWYLADRPLPPSYGRIMVALMLIGIPVMLVLKQPDLGTSLLIASSGIFVLLFAGISWKLIFGFLSVVGAFIPILWFYIMHPYQQQRVKTLFNPEADPLGTGYHIIQSKIAIGSGGIEGKGWLNGTQSQLHFLPERTTDFIYAVYSEEFGLIGAGILLLIYLFILSRGMYIAAQAQDTYGRLLAASLVSTFFIYIFINMGMVTGLLPVVGVPLPLVSYGGTSLVTLMASFGFIMAIHTHKRFLSQ